MSDEPKGTEAPEAPSPGSFGLFKDSAAPDMERAPEPASEPEAGALDGKEKDTGVSEEHKGVEKGEEVDNREKRAWDEISRRDREIIQRQKALREKEKQLEELSTLKQRAKENPAEVLESLGLDAREIAAQYVDLSLLGEDEGGAEDRSAKESQALKEQLKRLEEANRQSVSELNRYKRHNEISREIARGDFEAVSHVADVQGEAFLDVLMRSADEEEEQTGARPRWGAILERAESVLVENYCKYIKDALQLQSVKSRVHELLGQQESGHRLPEEKSHQDVVSRAVETSAIDNNLGSEPPKEEKDLTEEERRARFLQIMREKGFRRSER